MRTAILGSLSLASRKMQNYFDARLKAEGLTLARARAISCLAKAHRLSQAEFAHELDIESPTAVRLLDGLEKAGLLRRVPVTGDRRMNHIELTAEAQPLVEAINAAGQAGQVVLLDGIDDGDLQITLRVLSRIAENAAHASLRQKVSSK